MDLTEIVAAVIGAIGAVGAAWLAARLARRRRSPAPEQEAASVLDPQREYVTYLRGQVAELQQQLEECYGKRNDAVERAARLEERLRVLRREGSA